MRTFEWPIEDIGAAHPDLYLDHFVVMAVALMSRLSASPCEFLVECENFCPPDLEGENPFVLRVAWNDQTADAAARIWLTEQSPVIVEHAAVALAALTFAHLIPDGAMRVTKLGDRADYWLTRLECALEVSGTERRAEVSRRQREKTAQLLANTRQWDGYIFICCFSAASRLIRWSYHTQGETGS